MGETAGVGVTDRVGATHGVTGHFVGSHFVGVGKGEAGGVVDAARAMLGAWSIEPSGSVAGVVNSDSAAITINPLSRPRVIKAMICRRESFMIPVWLCPAWLRLYFFNSRTKDSTSRVTMASASSMTM